MPPHRTARLDARHNGAGSARHRGRLASFVLMYKSLGPVNKSLARYEWPRMAAMGVPGANASLSGW